ncbi:hypothetical protein LMIY3S_01796 [Labrys miyagiensis]
MSVVVGEHTAFLALASLKGVGYWTLARMAKEGVQFADFIAIDDGHEIVSALRKYGARIESKSQTDWRFIRERAIERSDVMQREFAESGTRLVMSGSTDYPATLYDLADAPPWIFVTGSLEILHSQCVTAVGTRTPSPDGLWLSQFVGHCFDFWQAPTVSGLANGIDQIVHEMSIRARIPTIAVLGTGIFSEYPKGSASIRERILQNGGAIVTEYLPSESYSAENFVRRNRLQAALGSVLIPIEWAPKSGTAHTVRYAASIGRPIAGLRLPDWDPDRVVFSNGAAKLAMKFNIPGQEAQFREFVAKAIASLPPAPEPTQLPLV